jgi:hypothetical protein
MRYHPVVTSPPRSWWKLYDSALGWRDDRVEHVDHLVGIKPLFGGECRAHSDHHPSSRHHCPGGGPWRWAPGADMPNKRDRDYT